MSIQELIFQTFPIVTIGTNKFINSKVILSFEGTPLIEVVQEIGIGYTPRIPIFHPDGTKLAVVKGTKVYLTEEGGNAGIIMDKMQGVTFCKLANQTLFEIHNQPGDAFKTYVELYTPEGYFVKYSDNPAPDIHNNHGQIIEAIGERIMGSTFNGQGIHISAKGGFSVY